MAYFINGKSFMSNEEKEKTKNTKTVNFEIFEQLCCDGYNILRNHGHKFIHLFLLMLSAGIPELRHEWQIGFLRNRLALHLTDVCFDKFLPLLGRSFHSI
jgi:hypothetical protein